KQTPPRTRRGLWVVGGTVLVLIPASIFTYRAGLSSRQALNTQTFTPYELVSHEVISSTCSIFTLQPAKTRRSIFPLFPDNSSASASPVDPYRPLWDEG